MLQEAAQNAPLLDMEAEYLRKPTSAAAYRLGSIIIPSRLQAELYLFLIAASSCYSTRLVSRSNLVVLCWHSQLPCLYAEQGAACKAWRAKGKHANRCSHRARSQAKDTGRAVLGDLQAAAAASQQWLYPGRRCFCRCRLGCVFCQLEVKCGCGVQFSICRRSVEVVVVV